MFLNLFDVFVNHVFGGIIPSWVGIALIMLVIALFSKMDELLIYAVVGLWTLTFWMFYVGGFMVALVFGGALCFFIFSLLNFIATRLT